MIRIWNQERRYTVDSSENNMKRLLRLWLLWCGAVETTLAFQPVGTRGRTTTCSYQRIHSPLHVVVPGEETITTKTTNSVTTTRETFFLQSAIAVASYITAATSIPSPVHARGRATLDQAYDRYTPRIIAGGEFYKKNLRDLVAKNDFEGIKRALAEPPKKSKEDRAKPDGGTTERAAQAGGFSDARVLVAADLFAATFSDNSVSAKTKKMKDEVANLRSIVEKMQSISRQALGEESGGGGLFGFGAKKASKDELSKKLKELYIEGGNAYNRYIFAANEGLPVQLKKLPFL